MRVIRGVALAVAAVIVLGVAVEAMAGYIDLIGYPELKAELDEASVSVPTGAGVAVMQVEGTEGGKYMPGDNTVAEFSGKTITDATLPPTTGTSYHAYQVGLNFYGNTKSVAPGITNITVYEVNDWLGTGFLKYGVTPTTAPAYSTSRIANHSWADDVGTSTGNAKILRRVDYLVETDDFLQVVAVNNVLAAGDTNQPLLADSFNAIAVGVTNGAHATGTTAVDGTYVAGRTKPDLVAPGESPDPTNKSIRTSWAAPMVSAAAALLVETGHNQTDLSNGFYTSPRTGLKIYHAETSEVVKAALMAGADRRTANGRGTEITDYKVDTANGLDSRFGAGQVNIYNSYHILTGVEQDSNQDGNTSDIGRYGFDYDPEFGGAWGKTEKSNTTGSYFFTADFASLAREIFASLVWNIDIGPSTGPGPTNPVGTATLYNLDLKLYDVTSGGTLVASSTSTLDNTENIWQQLVDGCSYRLDVVRGSGQGDFLWDYGLAWRIVPEPATVALLGLGGVALLLRRRRR